MTAAFAIWLVAGLALGAVHAWLLWKAAQPPFHWAGGVFLRILPVAAVFLAAGYAGGILPVAAGWAIAFPISVATIFLRSPR